jgi:tetratricopeptide (TPR) repeat protein
LKENNPQRWNFGSKTRLRALLLFWLGCSAVAAAQPDSIVVIPAKAGTTQVVFSGFSADRCWLAGQEFDVPGRRFVSADSGASCIPQTARRRRLSWRDDSLWWEADPYDKRYFWTYEYWHDSLILWRYNQETTRQDSFLSLPPKNVGTEFAVGKPGIWVTNHETLVLLDRHSGQVLHTAQNPFGSGVMMSMRPWGEDVIITDRWLFNRSTSRYRPFLPVPPEMEGCTSPDQLTFYGQTCVVQAAGSKTFIHTPPDRFITFPYRTHWQAPMHLLSAEPPLFWLSFPDKIVAFNLDTGDSTIYRSNTGTPLNGHQGGRFLGFSSPLGLCFFDKYLCQFRVLNRPFGFEPPRYFTSDAQRLYLTFEDRWEVVEVPHLEPAFNPSAILEEYDKFYAEWQVLYQNLPEDFDIRHVAFTRLFEPYASSQNPKIEAAKTSTGSGLSYLLLTAPDSTAARVAAAYLQGQYLSMFDCGIAAAVFRYLADTDTLEVALRLLETPGVYDCISLDLQSGDYFLEVLKSTWRQIDSIQQQPQSADRRLFDLGTTWHTYGEQKVEMRYQFDPMIRLKKSRSYFQKLLDQYPSSDLADDAAYALLAYVDYFSDATDDLTPQGDDRVAIQKFRQFLQDYPNSNRRPDVLLRMYHCVKRIGLQEEAGYLLQTIRRDHPEFALQSQTFQDLEKSAERQLWAAKWGFSGNVEKGVYDNADSIRFVIGVQNLTDSSQTLSAEFLNTWHSSIVLSLHENVVQGCEERWGNGQLTRLPAPNVVAPMVLPPGAWHQETFLLAPFFTRNSNLSVKFPLRSPHTYQYQLYSYLFGAQTNGRFTIE